MIPPSNGQLVEPQAPSPYLLLREAEINSRSTKNNYRTGVTNRCLFVQVLVDAGRWASLLTVARPNDSHDQLSRCSQPKGTPNLGQYELFIPKSDKTTRPDRRV